jgi:hypothetical protein
MKQKREAKSIVLPVKSIDKRIDNGRVSVTLLSGEKHSLRLRGIKDIYYHKGTFYVIYETEHPEFYENYVKELPRLAVYISFLTVEDLETGEKWIELDGDPVREVTEYVRKLLDKNLEFEDYLYGSTPTFSIEKIDEVELFLARIRGVAVVDNPVFTYGGAVRVYKGKFLVVEGFEKKTCNTFYTLFIYGGEDLVEAIKKGTAE